MSQATRRARTDSNVPAAAARTGNKPGVEHGLKPGFKRFAVPLLAFVMTASAAPTAARASGGRDDPDEVARFLRIFTGYLELIEGFSRIAHDPSASGVAASILAGEMLKDDDPQAAIDFFVDVLPEVNDPTVRRAIQLQLVDLYRDTGQEKQSLAVLRSLIVNDGTTGVPASADAGEAEGNSDDPNATTSTKTEATTTTTSKEASK